MNERIKDLIEEANLIEDRYALPDEFAQQFADLLIREVIDCLAITNVNNCAYTTYDQGVAECTRGELIRRVAENFGVDYTYHPTSSKIFPVRSK